MKTNKETEQDYFEGLTIGFGVGVIFALLIIVIFLV